MPKVHHVKKARKAIPLIGVKPGDDYYWWAIRLKGQRSGRKYVSKTQPKPSQLTSSDYMRSILELQEEHYIGRDWDDMECRRDDVRDRIQEILDEQQGRLDNMPEGLQQGDTGQLIQERIDCCENAVSELDSLDIPEKENFDGEEGDEEALQAWMDEQADELYEAVDNIIQELS